MFGQLPAVFAFRCTQYASQIGKHTPTRFWSGKAGSNAGMQLRQGLCHRTTWLGVVFLSTVALCFRCFTLFSCDKSHWSLHWLDDIANRNDAIGHDLSVQAPAMEKR